jgi:dTDP-4-amino-4,6-dideoxy-D-glucose acyltransferase
LIRITLDLGRRSASCTDQWIECVGCGSRTKFQRLLDLQGDLCVDRFYDVEDLNRLGFASLGQDVRIDRSVVLLNPAGIRIGEHTRIDAFCLISAFGPGISIGRNVHIAAGVYIYGGGGVVIEDFAGVSARCVIYSTNDDYSGEHLTGPTLPLEFTAVTAAPVHIGRHAVVGAGSIVLPGVTFGQGAVTGALSLIKRDVGPFTVVAGVPARSVKPRSQRLLELEGEYLRGERERKS